MARPAAFNRMEALNRAMLLFWNRGYSGTSAQDMVERLGLNRSSLYNSFSGKRSLFIEALKHYISQEPAGLVQALETMPPVPESIGLLLWQVVLQTLSGGKPKGCLVVNTAVEFAGADAEIQQLVQDNVNEVIAAFTRFIEKGQLAGTLSAQVPPGGLAQLLFNQITAIRVTGKVITDEAFFRENISTCIHIFT